MFLETIQTTLGKLETSVVFVLLSAVVIGLLLQCLKFPSVVCVVSGNSVEESRFEKKTHAEFRVPDA